MAFAPRFVVSSRISAFALFVTVPVFSLAFSQAAAAAELAAIQPGAVTSVPEPEGGAGTISGKAGPEAGPAVPEPAPTEPEPPTEPTEPTVAEPGAVPSEPGTEPAAPPSEVTPTPPVAEPKVDPSLLDAPEPEAAAPVATRTARPAGSSPEEQTAAIEDAYAARYRPKDNPIRLNIAGRLMFANISGQDRVNGRMGGASIDVGPSWNRVGISGTFTGWAGRVLLPPATGAELNAMVGGGLTLSLGRLALLSHGFLDLRLGYDIYYGAVNQRSDAPAILAAQSADPRVVAQLTQNLVPHGPRARLDLGLMGSDNRRFFHGFGLSMGYQALLGSFRGDLPMTSMLTIGLSYWMG
jgi:hypothetical protein